MMSILFPRRCIFCRKTAESGICDSCQNSLPWRAKQNEVIAPLFYRDSVRKALHRYKFQGYAGYAAVFGFLMSQAVRDAAVDAGIVTWVPCSRLRRWVRGYDQSEKLARAAAKHLGLPVQKLLVKARHTRSQTKMTDSSARLSNVKNAFRCPAAKGGFSGKRVLLIDDIYTTGATMAECRRTLLEAGAAEVAGCCAAARK